MVAASKKQKASTAGTKERLNSLDQFRGYTVVGMLLVNYFGGYAACPQILKHTNDYCSYADTIMPQFLFAVGFALRLTFGRRVQSGSSDVSYWRIVRRLLGLVLISMVVYNAGAAAVKWDQFKALSLWQILGEPMKRTWFQTLMHIAVTSLWILPVIHRTIAARIIWMVMSGVAHVALSYAFNFQWANTPPNAIDGGPLGFLTWSIPALVGSIACDYFVSPIHASGQNRLGGTSRGIGKAMLAAAGLMLLGYLFSCPTRLYDVPPNRVQELTKVQLAEDPVLPSRDRVEEKSERAEWHEWLAEPPLVKPPSKEYRKWNYWMMSQRAGTLSYLTFAAGFSLMVFGLFYVACDRLRWQVPLFRTFGTNALLAYIVHMMVDNAVQPFFPKDSPISYALLGLAIFFLINWIFVKQFEKQGVFVRV